MKKTIILLLTSICFFSCVEDEGNYDYTSLNEITIEGIEPSYNVLNKVDTIKISPIIKGSILEENLDNYEFQWHIHEGITDHKHTIIGNTKDLVYNVDLGIGDYTLYFTVKDKTTGLETTAYSSIKTSTAISKGYLLLGDDMEKGVMGLDMIVMPAGRDTTVAKNIYDNSETQFKGADKILYQGPRGGMVEKETLWMCTDDGSFRLSHHDGDLSIISEVNDYHLIETEFDHKKLRIKDIFPHPTNYYNIIWNCSYMYRGYMTEDMILVSATSTTDYHTTPCNRKSNTATELFNFYPYVFYGAPNRNSSLNIFVIYNTDENCFMKTVWNLTKATHSVEIATDKTTDPFPWRQGDTGRTIVWGGNSFDSSGHSYALMKDNEGKYYLYKFIAGGSYGYQFTKVGCYEIDLSVASNFANASNYMIASTGSILLYACGTKLCMYNFVHKMYKEYDMGADITCLKHDFVPKASRTEFFIATYSETEKGVVRKVDIGTNPNVLEIIERPNEIWNTDLRVKDIEFKTN